MALWIAQDKIDRAAAEALVGLCPFHAIEYDEKEKRLSINAGCKNCRLCVKKGPPGAIVWKEEAPKRSVDKAAWRGVAVFAQLRLDGTPHPVAFELLGKARALAQATGHPVYALVIGADTARAAEALLHYGADKVFVYDDPAFAYFRTGPYASAFYDFIERVRPSSILVGATNLGRSLAPRVAARANTGLTADCTALEMKENSDLVQIRPAFGGNIMARIVTPNARPQFCTARYKVFSAPPYMEEPGGEIVRMELTEAMRESRTEVLSRSAKPAQSDISEAGAIVACGRGFRNRADLAMAEELAALLGAQLACTRPLVEAGWMDARRQIGLSGRTVKPRLILTLGISGAVQFAAGMGASERIVSVNADAAASIFNVAHVGVVGDIYEIVPRLIARIQKEKEAAGHV